LCFLERAEHGFVDELYEQKGRFFKEFFGLVRELGSAEGALLLAAVLSERRHAFGVVEVGARETAQRRWQNRRETNGALCISTVAHRFLGTGLSLF